MSDPVPPGGGEEQPCEACWQTVVRVYLGPRAHGLDGGEERRLARVAARLHGLHRKVETATMALEWYGAERHWRQAEAHGGPLPGNVSCPRCDAGQRARDALAVLRKERP